MAAVSTIQQLGKVWKITSVGILAFQNDNLEGKWHKNLDHIFGMRVRVGKGVTL